MSKTAAWVIAGAVIATAGVAHAQDAALTTPTERAQVRAAVPWYERFTASTGITENFTGERESDRFTMPPNWAQDQRWGVTLDIQEARPLERGQPQVVRPDQTAVGAYYQFTPRVRVGGEVSLQAPANPANARTSNRDPAEPATGVRLESAFRF